MEDTILSQTQQNGQHMNDWNILDVAMYLARVSEENEMEVEMRENFRKQKTEEAEEEEEEEDREQHREEGTNDSTNDDSTNDVDSWLVGRRLTTQDDALAIPEHFIQPHLASSPTSPIVYLTASPALFGTEVPMPEQERQERQERQEQQEQQEEQEEQEMNDLLHQSARLSVHLNMVEPFYYGCADPDTLDPSLEGSVTNILGSSSGFGMIVYRGKCSFTQKARLAEWLGSSLLVVVDSDTEGFVTNPPKKSSTQQQQEQKRVQLFYTQLRNGVLPDELGKKYLF